MIAARKNKGLSQAKVAEALRRPQSFVAKYESGERRIDVIEFLDVAEALEIDPCEVLAHADLTVRELAEILDLRRERVARHVQMLARADILCRNRQGPWCSYHLNAGGKDGGLVQFLVDLLPHDDGYHKRDLERLEAAQDAWSKGTAA